MKRRKIRLTLVSLLILLATAINVTGCAMPIHAQDLMEGITANQISTIEDPKTQSETVTDFAVRLFQAANEAGESTLISPLSILYALAMTANGAKDNTLTQMEAVLGMGTEELNRYLFSYRYALPQGEAYKLSLANSIWFADRERFTADPDFLQVNADYYEASLYKAPFDKTTLNDINNWVKEKTEGMIPKILDDISEETVMYLVNALAFEAEWSEIYENNQVRDGNFTTEDGTGQSAEFMYSAEGTYLEDEKATGFIKYYKGGKYAFVAMLPNEGITVAEYVSSLDGESLHALLSDPQYVTVNTAIPKFETEYSTEISEVLKEMGMTEAFDASKANFTGLGSSPLGNIFINRVLHKTFLSVGEKGTKAGAATVVEMDAESAVDMLDPKQVYLDRPFVYMLIDCETSIPFFIGTMMNLAS